jgi:hypothetical protein
MLLLRVLTGEGDDAFYLRITPPIILFYIVAYIDGTSNMLEHVMFHPLFIPPMFPAKKKK